MSRGDSQFFGTIDLESPIVEGVSLAVGVRNSIDKSLPIAFAAGERIFICDYADLPIMWSGSDETRQMLAFR